MKKIIMIIVLVAFGVITQNSSIGAKQLEKPTKIINLFKDKNLAKVFAEQQGKNIEDVLNQESVDEVTFMDIIVENTPELDDQISSLQGIEYFNNISYLNFRNTSISDLTPITELEFLEILSIDNSPVRNINALSNVPSIRSVYLHNVPVGDISPLKNARNLETIIFRNTEVIDLSPLSIHADNQSFIAEVLQSKVTKKINKPFNNVLTIDNPIIGIDKKEIKPTQIGNGGILNSTNDKITWNNFSNPSNGYSVSGYQGYSGESTGAIVLLQAVVYYDFNGSQISEKPENVYSNVKVSNTTYYYMRMGKDYFNYQTIYKSGQRKIITTNSFIKNKCRTTRAANSCATMIKKLDYNKNVMRKGQYYIRNSKGVVTQYKEVIKNSHNKITKVRASRTIKEKLVKDYEQRYSYYKNKKVKVYIRYRFKNNKTSERREYRYNKKSQLKSNKNNKAYYYRTIYKNGKVSKTIKANYTKNGGKVKYRTVEIRR